jgi:hypothetical protein
MNSCSNRLAAERFAEERFAAAHSAVLAVASASSFVRPDFWPAVVARLAPAAFYG